jgi:hypothetical protein
MCPPPAGWEDAHDSELRASRRDAGRAWRDAERYRWLRDADRSDESLPYSDLLALSMESLDAAIDAAMEQK